MSRAIVLLVAVVGCGSHVMLDDDAGDAKIEAPDANNTPEGCNPVTWYPDLDGDGCGAAYPTTQGMVVACSAPQDGKRWVSKAGDCADQDPATNPNVTVPSAIAIAGPHPRTRGLRSELRRERNADISQLRHAQRRDANAADVRLHTGMVPERRHPFVRSNPAMGDKRGPHLLRKQGLSVRRRHDMVLDDAAADVSLMAVQ
jgi:hypothetical protein